MGLLASMCSDVDRQGTPLDEGLAAVIVTYVRPLICVDAVVPLQVRLAVEALPAVSVTESKTAGRDTHLFAVGLRTVEWPQNIFGDILVLVVDDFQEIHLFSMPAVLRGVCCVVVLCQCVSGRVFVLSRIGLGS